MGIFFKISRDLEVEPIIPKITYSNRRDLERQELKDYRKRFKKGIDFRLLVRDSLNEIYNTYTPFEAYLFGTGELSDYAYKVIDKHKIILIGYFDNNTALLGKRKNGLLIQEPELKKKKKIVIASSFDRAISKQLLRMGYESKDILCLV